MIDAWESKLSQKFDRNNVQKKKNTIKKPKKIILEHEEERKVRKKYICNMHQKRSFNEG